MWTRAMIVAWLIVFSSLPTRADDADAWRKIAPYFAPPAEFAGKLGDYRSPLLFEDGTPVRDAKDWPRRREEIIRKWQGVMGPWPALLERPTLEVSGQTPKDGYTQWSCEVAVAARQKLKGYLL